MLLNFNEPKMQFTADVYMILKDYNMYLEMTWLRGQTDIMRKPVSYSSDSFTCIYLEKAGRACAIKESSTLAEEYVFVRASFGFKNGKPTYIEERSYEFVFLNGKICFVNNEINLSIKMFDRLDRSSWNDRVYIATTNLTQKDSKEELISTFDKATKTKNIFYLERMSDKKPVFRFIKISKRKGEPEKFTYSLPFTA